MCRSCGHHACCTLTSPDCSVLRFHFFVIGFSLCRLIFMSPISITLNPSRCLCRTSLCKSLIYCFMGSSSFSCAFILLMQASCLCHIDSVALSSVFFDGAYVPITKVFFFRPLISTPFHLPHPRGSFPLLVAVVYLAMTGCTAIVTPPTLLFAAAAWAHLYFFCVPMPPHPAAISTSIFCLWRCVCCL